MPTGSTEQARAADPAEAPAVAAIDPPSAATRSTALAARLEPFDSYWQAPDDVEKGYASFFEYYRHNYLPRMPREKSSRILVISCGPGYLVNMLRENGYENVVGIDSDPQKIAHAQRRGLDCTTARAFEYLAGSDQQFDAIVPEQELNHLTLEEQIEFLTLCRQRLRSGGLLLVYGLNGANPLVGSENLAHNVDHFNTFTEHSISQVLQLGGFERIEPLPLKIYVFWKNPMNYVGLAVTGLLELGFRIVYKMYGKNVRILTKKIAATAVRP
ncbi:MAG: class I SAM-dependent methyltransferase [Gammaproteobacteria bacterium]|nr:class I SAM-dependent methyltransferase [Gammaproteobacteria bacterium]